VLKIKFHHVTFSTFFHKQLIISAIYCCYLFYIILHYILKEFTVPRHLCKFYNKIFINVCEKSTWSHKRTILCPKQWFHICRFLDEVRPTAWNDSFVRIGVHVRAGDILTPFNLFYGFTVPGSSYYIQAAYYLTANVTVPVQFIVATDNLNWTKKYVGLDEVFRNRSTTSVVYSEGNSAGFDMALLASCDALILSTGSYGWWAAWLANKTTIYYGNWPRPGSIISTMFTREDYFPPHWIGLGNASDHTTNIHTNKVWLCTFKLCDYRTFYGVTFNIKVKKFKS